MGMANMDFVVRECRSAVDGQMAVVRLGTCGALRPPAKLGDFLVAADGALIVRWTGRGSGAAGAAWRRARRGGGRGVAAGAAGLLGRRAWCGGA
jgi:hypothetical protein